MKREHTARLRVGRVLPLALCAISVGGLFPGCNSSGLGKRGSTAPDGSSRFDSGTGGASGIGTGGATSSATSESGGVTSGGVTGTGGTAEIGGTTGAAGASASSPADAGFDQAIDAPQADAQQGGASGSGGITAAGGSTRTGGATGMAGATASSPADARFDGRGDGVIEVQPADGLLEAGRAASSCENPLPLQCGDLLNHSTLVQGRANVWSSYSHTQRWESGPETIYAFQATAACQVVVQLKNLTVDLDLFLMTSCQLGSDTMASSTPLDLQTIETVGFTTEAGQPYFVVVDGYNGSAGTYTLEVNCTCKQDAGTSDVPQADAQGEAAIAPGCDLSVASSAIATDGLTAVGAPQTLDVTLPTTLPTDDNWGLKATVCQEGGYDITPLAGKTVCLVGQDISQTCQGAPARVWVLMDNGAVRCVYKAVRPGVVLAPGVYSATDPTCAQPTIAAGASVLCAGSSSCTSATGPCCPALVAMDRVGMCSPGCPFPSIACDGPEDCGNVQVCCSLESVAAGFMGASCVSATSCGTPSRVICHQQADCPSPQSCGPPNPKPAYLPPQVYPMTEWFGVSFQVCAP